MKSVSNILQGCLG